MSPSRREGYHHGALRAALVETAIELIDERGVHDFSLAEVSRRLGVAASAPYAHFADRDELLAAVVTHALHLFQKRLFPALKQPVTARERLAIMARTYVQFAAAHDALFRALFQLQIDKARHPQVAAAEAPIDERFRECVRAVCGGDPGEEEPFAAAVEAVIHGHAALLLDGRFGRGRGAVRTAADSAARSTVALATGWT